MPPPYPPPSPVPKPPTVPRPVPKPPPGPTGDPFPIPNPPPDPFPPNPQPPPKHRCNCTPTLEEDEDVAVIKWINISVPVGYCRTIGGKHVFATTYKTIAVISTGNGNEAAKVRGLYQAAHDNLKSNCQAADNNLLDLLNALNTGMLAKIDAKLGPQLPGGISGFLQGFRSKMERFIKWSHADRIMNVLNLWATIHNAFMLSRNLGETLFSLFDNIFAGLGIHLKDEEGENLDVSEWVGQQLDTTFKLVFGTTNWTTAKKEWQKWNRIYQAAANVVWTIRSLGDTVLGALEIVGSYVAKIGNAAKRAGEVMENAYGWMNVTPRFSNKWMNRVETVENTVSDLDSVVSEVREVGDVTKEIQESRERLTKSISQADDGEQAPATPEASKTATTESTAKTESQSPEIPNSDL